MWEIEGDSLKKDQLTSELVFFLCVLTLIDASHFFHIFLEILIGLNEAINVITVIIATIGSHIL